MLTDFVNDVLLDLGPDEQFAALQYLSKVNSEQGTAQIDTDVLQQLADSKERDGLEKCYFREQIQFWAVFIDVCCTRLKYCVSDKILNAACTGLKIFADVVRQMDWGECETDICVGAVCSLSSRAALIAQYFGVSIMF